MGNNNNISTLPAILTIDSVPFPDTDVLLPIRSKKDNDAFKESVTKTQRLILLIPLFKPLKDDELEENDYSKIGVLAVLNNESKRTTDELGNNTEVVRASVQNYVKISDVQQIGSFYVASGTNFDPIVDMSKQSEINTKYRSISNIIASSGELQSVLPANFLKESLSGIDVDRFIHVIAGSRLISYAAQLRVLNAKNALQKLNIIEKELPNTISSIKVNKEVLEQTQKNAMKSQTEYFLREQLKAIKQKLGDDDSDTDEVLKKLEEEPYPDNIKKKIRKEYKRLGSMAPGSPDYSTTKTYIDTMLSIPWYQKTTDNDDLNNVREILDNDHYELTEPKKRIVEYLAVKKMTGTLKSPILCFYGPPGTGKTSLATSIAKALGRKFFKCSLGGVYDEAEIRGHRRTYVASLPGKIIYGMQKSGVVNPVFLLDEIDKLGDAGMKGDPASALLEVLDPEQNFAFNDNYVEEPYDLSNVLFIATANTLETIPGPLRDRLELINLSSYTTLEKLEIAKRHLIRKSLSNCGLKEGSVEFTDEALLYIIEHYTLEAGVRGLERKISSIVRKVVVEMVDSKRKTKKNIDVKRVIKALGVELYENTKKEVEYQVGVVTGLAYTQYGGDILSIEVNSFPGKGGLIITGQLGDVMKESCSIALDYIKANAEHFGIKADVFTTRDIHIHVPEGAVPKDGPSAGVAITVAIISCLTNKSVNPDIAMTGEVTLRGNVLPIGGLKEKTMAAVRTGIKTVIVPKQNKPQISEISEEVKSKLEIIYMSQVDDALKVIFKND